MTTTVNSKKINRQPACSSRTDEHDLSFCSKFLEFSPHERYDFTKRSDLCHNCFNQNHRTINFRKGRCRKCHTQHNLLLHFDQQTPAKEISSSSQSATSLVSLQSQLPARVILGTVVIEILDGKGHTDPHYPIGTREFSCNLIKYHELPLLWKLGPENTSKFRSKEEQDCEIHYIDNTKRNETGRYVVKLPFNNKKNSLGDSHNAAFQRFLALEKKFKIKKI